MLMPNFAVCNLCQKIGLKLSLCLQHWITIPCAPLPPCYIMLPTHCENFPFGADYNLRDHFIGNTKLRLGTLAGAFFIIII